MSSGSKKQSDLFSSPADAADDEILRDLLGYLNFSDGTPGNRFRACINQLFLSQRGGSDPQQLQSLLLGRLQTLQSSGAAAFAVTDQAELIIRQTLSEVLPAYRAWHCDLLAHCTDEDFFSPLLLARMFETTLAVRAERSGMAPTDAAREAARRLNHFLGYRPVAVLENGRRAQPYDHERFCVLPLYMVDVGVASGRYHGLISAAIQFMQGLPEELLAGTHFSFARLSELSLDVRAHDHTHPVTKRTNYIFGEWDPDEIDTKGYYRRFVVRRLILDALLSWISKGKGRLGAEDPERLYDAAAVLTGTILMGSSISGSGPQTWDSSVSLTSLLPMVARQRDCFYSELLEQAEGERRKRLRRLATSTRQPFGHVRHQLNLYLAKYGADQVQHRHLSWVFARMGYEQASREEASVIPSLAARFESEISARLVTIPRHLRAGKPEEAARLMDESLELLERAIHCGGFVDPWNILGFQGLFPLFSAREDSIPDTRVDSLLELMGLLFDTCALIMSEAAASGKMDVHEHVLTRFRLLAEQWDRYATTTVNDLTKVEGQRSVDSAIQVARALARWREAGEAAGDISFWRQHVEEFASPSSFAQVVTSLLDRHDHVAAMGLLMQWLSRADSVPLESGPHSIHRLLHRLLDCVCQHGPPELRWIGLRRLFAFMEANAGEFWEVPRLNAYVEQQRKTGRRGKPGDELDLEHLFDGNDEEQDTLAAAWDEVTYRDSTDDGNVGDTMDSSITAPGTTEFEILYRQIEPRLKFLHTVGSLWSIAAVWVSRQQAQVSQEHAEMMRDWLVAIRGRLQGLGELVSEVRDYEISVLSSGLEGNLEYDIQLQCRFLLMQNALSTTVEFLMAERLIEAVVGSPGKNSDTETLDQLVSAIFTAVFSRRSDEVRKLFPAFCRELGRRPLLYVPFENGGQPAAILKARTLQAILRVLLGQLPRLGLLTETFVLLQTALKMERNARPSGQAVTEFDRLFRLGLQHSTEALLKSCENLQGEKRLEIVEPRLRSLTELYAALWVRHSGSMRLSVVEDLQDRDFDVVVQEFIKLYGDELFHTRMLTLGNIRAILHHGVSVLFAELEEMASTQPIMLLDHMDSGMVDKDDAEEVTEFVLECLVDNFDRFMEYNTTTTYSDYGSRLYCLLDFLKLEAVYDRFEWNHIPWQLVHEVLVRKSDEGVAAALKDAIKLSTASQARELVSQLSVLEKSYGVKLPALHDHINEQIVGVLEQNAIAAMVSRACPADSGVNSELAEATFQKLRIRIANYMKTRSGSGIEPPEWMQRLVSELDQIQNRQPGNLSTTLSEGEYEQLSMKELDSQLTKMRRLNK
ncbi:MAG: hypothetical protein ACK5ES_10705 [Planctomyces sp.]